MLRQGELILKLFCTFLIYQHSIQGANGIIQLKPQQVLGQSKTQHAPQNVQAQQQSPMKQQQATLQHHPQQAVLENSKNINEKETLQETTIKDVNQEIDRTNSYDVVSEAKRENHLPSPFPPLQFSPPGPTLPRGSALPTPAWNPNPFINQGFGTPPPPPPAYAPHPYPMHPYAIPPFSVNSYSPIPYQATPYFGTPKFLPFMGYPQQFFIPYAPFFPPEFFYSPYPSGINDFEEATSRSANGRRPPLTNPRDSPIYYMRLPPTPYMFMPNFGYQTNQNTNPLNYGSNFPPIVPFPPIQPTYPGLSQTFNLPINFLANGKPSGIHSFIPDIQNSLPFSGFNGFNPRPQGPPLSGNYFQPPYSTPPSPPPPPPYQNSKLTSLKQPFYFNGRPEDIYVLQSNLNPLYSGL